MWSQFVGGIFLGYFVVAFEGGKFILSCNMAVTILWFNICEEIRMETKDTWLQISTLTQQ